MINNIEIEYIDDVLSELEDYIKGDIGDKITIARSKLRVLIKELKTK